MKRYRQTIFSEASPVRTAIALTKLLQAAVDAQNRQLEAADRGHHNMSRFYSSVNLLCLKRLGILIQCVLDPVSYRYAGRFYADTTTGHMVVLGNVRGWRLEHKGVVALGRNFRRVI